MKAAPADPASPYAATQTPIAAVQGAIHDCKERLEALRKQQEVPLSRQDMIETASDIARHAKKLRRLQETLADLEREEKSAERDVLADYLKCRYGAKWLQEHQAKAKEWNAKIVASRSSRITHALHALGARSSGGAFRLRDKER